MSLSAVSSRPNGSVEWLTILSEVEGQYQNYKFQHAAQAPALRVTKTGKYEESAPNPESVFVLNFENWDLNIAWNLRFEYWNLVWLVYPFENGVYCQNR